MTRPDGRAGWDPWTYRRDTGITGHATDLVGFGVEATDGTIGTITEATYDGEDRDKDTRSKRDHRDRLGEYYSKYR